MDPSSLIAAVYAGSVPRFIAAGATFIDSQPVMTFGNYQEERCEAGNG